MIDVEKSKSQLKREHKAIADLGLELTQLSAPLLEQLPLAADTREAVDQARKMTRGARQRQLRYLAGVLANDNVDAIRHSLNEARRPQQQAKQRFHLAENWRDRLLSEGDEAMSLFVREYPNADTATLRRLVRQAHKEASTGKSPVAARTLFRSIRDLLDSVS